jgi:hypothetical protein
MECGNLKHGIRFIFKHEMLSLRKHEFQNIKHPMFELDLRKFNTIYLSFKIEVFCMQHTITMFNMVIVFLIIGSEGFIVNKMIDSFITRILVEVMHSIFYTKTK